MPLGLPNIPIFQVLVLLPTGLPFAGARLRVFNSIGTDVTQTLTGESVIVTEGTGQRAYFLNSNNVLPEGAYKIVTANPGYDEAFVSTPATFTGEGSFSIMVAPRSVSPTSVPQPAKRAVSCMFPVEIVMPAPDVAPGDWQLIETIVTDEAAKQSSIETPVVGGLALVNVANRFSLAPGFHFVGDGQAYNEDSDFAKTFVVTGASVSPSGEIPLQGSAIYLAANMVPDGNTNDLTSYTDDGQGLAKWIVWGDVYKWAGHYLDVMIWLPKSNNDTKRIILEYYTALGQSVVINTDTSINLFGTTRALRIAIPDAPTTNTAYVNLYAIDGAGNSISETLTVNYFHA